MGVYASFESVGELIRVYDSVEECMNVYECDLYWIVE